MIMPGVLFALHERRATNDRDPLARFRAHQFSIAIDAGPISVDELHRFPACTAFRRRALIDHGEIRQFKIVFIWQPSYISD